MIKKLDFEKLNKYIEEGLIRQRWNDDKTLFTLNYTEHATYSNKWDLYTRSSRGHSFDKDGNLVMPSMDKFFNLFQLPTAEQKRVAKWMTDGTPFEVTQKYDGCIVTIYPYNGHLIITSKSTFGNYVTEACERVMKDKIFINDLETTSSGLVCELICPETRQIVDYGNLEELRVITSFNLCETDNEYLQERSYDETKDILDKMGTGLKMVDRVEMTFDELKSWMKTSNWEKEGFVVKNTQTNERVKFKSEDYLRVASIKSNLNFTHLLNTAIANGTSEWKNILSKMVESLPDELQKLADKMITILEMKYEFNYDKIFMLAQKVKGLDDRQLGLYKIDEEVCKYKNLIFQLRHNKDITKSILEMVKQEIKDYESTNGPITPDKLPEWRKIAK